MQQIWNINLGKLIEVYVENIWSPSQILADCSGELSYSGELNCSGEANVARGS
ncbi:MAG: hypothetical protein KBC30_10320 [Planctomycetes bacterium]|nr:hypothetical protein [Planctomycetota bacterium]HPY74256.1 hypothetical protein [Planctomycetota bacterium]HQB01425.1 hypothetical protein [Planctomycetota bacterium]